MPDQDYAVLAVLLFTVLLIAMVIPAPTRAPRHEAGVHTTLLGTGAALAILAGVLALAQLPVHSAAGGALAWLIVMPCVWMARAPAPAEGYGYDEEEDDDDGGEPWPRWPRTPLSPEGRRPELASSGWSAARPASTRPLTAAHLPQHAMASRQPALSAAVVRSSPLAAETDTSVAASAPPAPSAPTAAEPAVATQQRRLAPRPRGQRADHRSIVHNRAASHHPGRRRRASLRHRVLNRCRMWLWVEPPECVTFAEPEHQPLPRRTAADRRRDARSKPLV